MNDVVTFNPRSVANNKTRSDLPQPTTEEAFEIEARQVHEIAQVLRTIIDPLDKTFWEHGRLWRSAVAAANAAMAQQGALAKALEEGEELASRQDIQAHVALLVGSFPNANPGDPEVYVRMLIEDIGARQPSLLVLESACRAVRRSSRFLPSLAEILEAFDRSEKDWSRRAASIRELPDLLTQAEPALAELQAQHQARVLAWERDQAMIKAREEEERKRYERAAAACLERMRQGESDFNLRGDFSRYVVDGARHRLRDETAKSA